MLDIVRFKKGIYHILCSKQHTIIAKVSNGKAYIQIKYQDSAFLQKLETYRKIKEKFPQYIKEKRWIKKDSEYSVFVLDQQYNALVSDYPMSQFHILQEDYPKIYQFLDQLIKDLTFIQEAHKAKLLNWLEYKREIKKLLYKREAEDLLC